MSERMTSIDLPGLSGFGLADWGRLTPADMIAQARSWARDRLRVAEAVLAARDDAFHVETYRGVHARRDREVLQEGTAI